MAMRIKFGAPIINWNWSRGFFSCSGRVSFYAPNILCANKLARCKYEGLVWSASLFVKQNRLFILLERAEKEIRFSMANGTFKTKMDIDRHGPRLMPNNCKNLNPPYFSLPSTFKLWPVCFIKIRNLCVVSEKISQETGRKYGKRKSVQKSAKLVHLTNNIFGYSDLQIWESEIKNFTVLRASLIVS